MSLRSYAKYNVFFSFVYCCHQTENDPTHTFVYSLNDDGYPTAFFLFLSFCFLSFSPAVYVVFASLSGVLNISIPSRISLVFSLVLFFSQPAAL